MFVTDLLILWHVRKRAICLKYFALRGVTCLRRRKYVVGNSFEMFIFCGTRIEFQSLFNLTKINLLLLSKSLMFLSTKNRKVTLTKSKRTGTKNIEHNIPKTSVFFKAF